MAFSRNALPPREQALAELASCDPADLSKVAKLRVIHSRCAQAGVLTGASVSSATATAHAASAAGDGASDVAKLHQLFDAAVANGMPQLVCHYVDEVCGHDDFSSPDGVEAYLQDGEMVAEWCSAALRSAEQALDQAAALRTAGAADEADRAGAVFEALRDVLVALGADPAAGGDSAEATDASAPHPAADAPGFQQRLQLAHDDAARRMQHAAALSWALREGLTAGTAASQDRYGGPGQWASEINVRRASAAAAARAADLPPDADGGGLFLDDLLAGVGVHAPPYPFKSATEAAERVFRHGSAAPAALVAKQALFLYYLLDLGAPPEGAPARFARAARMHPRLFVETRCAALLDDHERVESLTRACALLPGASHPGLPLRFVASLAARGKPADALAVARARRSDVAAGFKRSQGESHDGNESMGDVSVGGASAGFEADATVEAELGVAVRLECGLATEAFVCARDAVAAAPHDARRGVADKLVSRLASHAAARGALESVLDLPFEGELESAMMSWLESNAGTAGAARHLPVVYYLTRGRTTEAAACAANQSGGAKSLPPDVLAALEAAVRCMPEPMQRLRMTGAAEARDDASGGKRALARGLVVQPATPMDFARTPAGAVIPNEKNPSAGGVLCAMDGALHSGDDRNDGGHVPFFAAPLASSHAAANTLGSYGTGVSSNDTALEPPSPGPLARAADQTGARMNAKAATGGGGDSWTALDLRGSVEDSLHVEADVDADVDADMDDVDMDDDMEEAARGRPLVPRTRAKEPAASRVPEPAAVFSPFGAKKRRAAERRAAAAAASAPAGLSPAPRHWTAPAFGQGLGFGPTPARQPAMTPTPARPSPRRREVPEIEIRSPAEAKKSPSPRPLEPPVSSFREADAMVVDEDEEGDVVIAATTPVPVAASPAPPASVLEERPQPAAATRRSSRRASAAPASTTPGATTSGSMLFADGTPSTTSTKAAAERKSRRASVAAAAAEKPPKPAASSKKKADPSRAKKSAAVASGESTPSVTTSRRKSISQAAALKRIDATPAPVSDDDSGRRVTRSSARKSTSYVLERLK